MTSNFDLAMKRRVRIRRDPPRVWADIHDVEERYRKRKSTIDRWLNDRTLGFPRPRLVRGKRIWHTAELDAFDEQLLRDKVVQR